MATPASAQDSPPIFDASKMELEFQSQENAATNSDLAFWGDYAFVGYYTGDAGNPPTTPPSPRGGVRIFDISNPADPELIKDFPCDGPQNDPILWDRNGNGVPDLLLLAVDRTMADPGCAAARVPSGTPTGWEGVRVFEMSDNPANPFQTITPAKMQYTDCGAHTITAWTGKVETERKLIVYVSSYPLSPGPTCGDPEYQNEANPYDEDPGSPDSPLHGVIQVLEVPLDNPAATRELEQQPISYPGDPDGKFEYAERGLTPTAEAAQVACHDIVTHMEHNLAGAACGEQGQIWEIDPDTGIPDTQNPISIGDDEVSSGGTGQFPGAVDFFHSVMFNNDGTVVNWVDESFGSGCPTMTNWQARPWHPAGTHKTGRMFFSDLDGNFLSEFHVGDLRPNNEPGAYCSAHMGMAAMGINRDLLVNAWYTGGVNVIDFSKPTRLKETAFFDMHNVGSSNWSAYPYTGPLFKKGPGVPVYASDGVGNVNAGSMLALRTLMPKPGRRALVDHLNPQTMDHEMMRGSGKGKGRGKKDRDH
jgi:hypothetical protein